MIKNNMLRQITIVTSLMVTIINLLVLLVWTTPLGHFLPGLGAIKPNTALGMFLFGASMAMLSYKKSKENVRFWVMLTSIVIVLTGVLNIFENLFQMQFKVEQIIFKNMGSLADLSTPGGMSSSTAFCYFSIGIAMLMASQTANLYLRKPCIAALGIMVFIISTLAIFSNVSIQYFGFHFWDYTGITQLQGLVFLLAGISLFTYINSDTGFNWSLDVLMTSGFIIGFVTLLAAGYLTYRYTNQLREDDERVSHTQEAIKEINDMALAHAVLENGERGYIITGNKKLLDTQLQYKSILKKTMASFYTLTATDNYQQSHREAFTTLMTKKLAWNDELIKVRQQQGFDAAQKMLLTGTGIDLSEKITQQISDMLNEEYLLLEQREEIENHLFVTTFTVLPLGTFISLAMLMMGFFILNAGIEERNKTESSRILLAEIVSSSNDAIIGETLDGTVTSWNKAAEKIFGYCASEMIGQPISRIISQEKMQEDALIWDKIKLGETIEQFETERLRKDKRKVNISATISPIKNVKQDIIGMSTIIRDVTEKKLLEQQLRQSQKMEAVGQLTGGVAHDFNNLLGIILGNLDLLERTLDGNEAALKRVNTTVKAATRGADLTKRLLAFSRMQQLNPKPVSLEESINNTVEMAKRTLGPDIKIITKPGEPVPPVFVDAAELESVLLNLAVNARDAMPKGGVITIETRLKTLEKDYAPVQAGELKPGVYACVSVTDTGHGMSRETMERVFEPFFTTKPRGKGTGLGLAMVYGFIKQSGGIIRIYSELNQGTSISFYLPLADKSLLTADNTKTGKMAAHPKVTGTVLVVDDEVDLLEIAAIYLKDMGYKVLEARDAKSALVLAGQNPDINLLVTDVIMPGGMNGVELAANLRELKENISIVYTSGFPSSALAERSGTKIDGPLINKPYQRDVFVAAILHAMKK